MLVVEKDSDITAQAVNAMLQGQGFRTIGKVQIHLTDYESAMSEIRRLVLHYEGGQGAAPKTLILKFARILPEEHWINTLISVDRTYNREVTSYHYLESKEVQGRYNLDLLTKVYYAAVSPNGMRFTLLMEDLEGPYHQVRQSAGIDLKTAQQAVVQLARFHAPLANNPEVEKVFEPYSRFFSNIKSFAANNILCEEFMERVQSLFQSEIAILWNAVKQANFAGTLLQGSHLQEYLGKVDLKLLSQHHKQMLQNMLNFDKAEIKGLMHCDLRCENIFFGEKGIKLVDWKYGLVGLPMSDVLRFLVQNLRSADLHKNCDDLIKLYSNEFEQASKLKVTEAYRNMSVLNYIMVELHFLASTLSFLKDVPANEIKQMFQDRVVEVSFVMLDRTMAFYWDQLQQKRL